MKDELEKGNNEKVKELFNKLTPKTRQNVEALIGKFEKYGLTLDGYIPACIKQPALFSQSPDTISRHIDIIRFSNFNMDHKVDTKEFWQKILKHPLEFSCADSTLLVTLLIIPKMFEGGKIPNELKGNRLKQKLVDYLIDNPDKTFNLNLRQLKTNTDCIGLLREYLDKISKDVGRENIFNINITE